MSPKLTANKFLLCCGALEWVVFYRVVFCCVVVHRVLLCCSVLFFVALRYSALYVCDKEDRAGRHVSCIHYPLPPSQWYYPGNAAGNILIFGTILDIFADYIVYL